MQTNDDRSDDLLNDLCSDYASYLLVNSSDEVNYIKSILYCLYSPSRSTAVGQASRSNSEPFLIRRRVFLPSGECRLFASLNFEQQVTDY